MRTTYLWVWHNIYSRSWGHNQDGSLVFAQPGFPFKSSAGLVKEAFFQTVKLSQRKKHSPLRHGQNVKMRLSCKFFDDIMCNLFSLQSCPESELVLVGLTSCAGICLGQEVGPHLGANWFSTDVYRPVQNHKITKQSVLHNKSRLDCFSSLRSFHFVSVFVPLPPNVSISPLVMSISRSVRTFCCHYCGPLWPHPHIYKASEKTRMIIVVGHPQDTVQCMGLGDWVPCVSVHFYLFIRVCSCTGQLGVHNTSCDRQQNESHHNFPLTFLKRINCTSFVPRWMPGTNKATQVRSFT